jgi:hypothetical protein
MIGKAKEEGGRPGEISFAVTLSISLGKDDWDGEGKDRGRRTEDGV